MPLYLLFAMLLSLFLTCGLAISSALEATYYDVHQAEQLFEEFILTYNRTYSAQDEKQKRLEIFKKTLQICNEKNSIGGAVFAINGFSDLTGEELEYYMGYKPSLFEDNCKRVTDMDINTNNAPERKNWVELGAVTVVKNQNTCGSCWAFATIGNIEGQYFLKTGNLVSFSEQELVDCSKSNKDCNGGLPTVAMTDLINLGGVVYAETYPYENRKGQCRFNINDVVTLIVGCEKYALQDENKLKEVLAQRGPLAIGLDGTSLQTYHGGIVESAHCESSPINHAVLLVGYGTDNGKDYWLIKNSWDTTWGEGGYGRLARGQNTCGMMTQVSACANL